MGLSSSCDETKAAEKESRGKDRDRVGVDGDMAFDKSFLLSCHDFLMLECVC